MIRTAVIWFDDNKSDVWTAMKWMVGIIAALWMVNLFIAAMQAPALGDLGAFPFWHAIWPYYRFELKVSLIVAGGLAALFGGLELIEGGYRKLVRWARSPEYVARKLEGR